MVINKSILNNVNILNNESSFTIFNQSQISISNEDLESQPNSHQLFKAIPGKTLKKHIWKIDNYIDSYN